MSKPRLVGRTGVAAIDRQSREFGRGGQVVTVTISGQTRPVYKSVSHLLGFVPQSWKQVGGPSGVAEPPDGMRANRNDVTLLFPGNGTWQISLE